MKIVILWLMLLHNLLVYATDPEPYKDSTSMFCDMTNPTYDPTTGLLEVCKIIVPAAIKEAYYVISAMNIQFTNVELSCPPKDKTLCGFEFKAKNAVSIKNSKISASMLLFTDDIVTFTLDSDSVLNSTGMGNLEGPSSKAGYSPDMGASYAGQGGSKGGIGPDLTYGKYDQTPDDDNSHLKYYSMGSGGGDPNKRGGGAIMITTKNGQFSGAIVAAGTPTSTKLSNEYHAGSGGYIYINCTLSPCVAHNQVSVNGGSGTDDQKSCAGSGGRIVLNNFSGPDNLITASGGCSNTLASYNGAAGTIYFADTKTLLVRDTSKCYTTMNTIIESDSMKNLNNFEVKNQASFTFKLAKNQESINVSVKNVTIYGKSVFAAPVSDDDIDEISITVEDTFYIQNATMVNPAKTLKIMSQNMIMGDDSRIRYHTELELRAQNSMLINGTIQKNDPSKPDGTNKGIVRIYAGNPLDNIIPGLNDLRATSFVIAEDAILRSDFIMIFSNQPLLIYGLLENTYEDDDGKQQLNGHCQNVTESNNTLYDVFNCIPRESVNATLDYKTYLTNYNLQYNKSLETVEDVYNMMPSNYSIYILDYSDVTMYANSTLRGDRIGICVNNMNAGGTISATGAGCKSNSGYGTGMTDPENCCNFSGGSYGGIGLEATVNTKQCPDIDDINCGDYVGSTYGTTDYLAFQGSGGGGTNGGKGGGSIWMNIAGTLNITGIIESNGTDSESDPGSTYGSGGGSGGSISIFLNQIKGSANAAISVIGGNGKFGGGAGAGGWFYGTLYDSTNIDKLPYSSENWAGKVFLHNGESLSGNMFSRTSKKMYESTDIHYGRTFHPPCLAGFEKGFCSPCVQGFYKDTTSIDNCVACSNKPSSNSKYIRKPGEQIDDKCPYECISSVPNKDKNPHCYNSFDWFIDTIGGWPVVIVSIFAIAFCIFCLWFYIKMKAKKRALKKAKYSFENMNLTDKRRVLDDEAFTTADLPYQICRAYFRGTNSPYNQWTIPVDPPLKLKNVVFISSYEEFTTSLNHVSKWRKMERIWYYFLLLLFPPFFYIYVRKIRKKKFKRLRQRIMSEFQKGIWLHSEQRNTHMATKAIKISASNDYTMAYLDFLDLDKDREFYNGPVLPITFHLSGDGFFNAPFSLNYNDCLVKSLSLLDQSESFIDIYIENLNSYLQSLGFFEFLSLSETKFWDLIRFLHNNNSGILKKRSIKAELAVLEYLNKGNKTVRMQKMSQIDAINECSQTYIFHFDFINKYPQTVRNIVDYCRYEMYKGKKDIKLALIFSRIDQSTLITSYGHHNEIQAISPRSGFRSTLMFDEFKRSSVRQTKATSPRFYEREESNANSSDEPTISNKNVSGVLVGFKTNWNEPLIMKEAQEINVESKHSFSATGSVYSNASYAPNRIEVESYDDNENGHIGHMYTEEHPLIAFKNRRHGRDCCFRFKMFFLSFYHFVFLRNTLPPKYPIVNLSIMIILVFVDFSAALMLFLLYEHENKFQIPLIPFCFVYPFTVILCPIVAMTAIFICKASFYRVFLNLNALSCTTNIFFTLVFEIVFLFMNSEAKSQLRGTETIEPIIILCSKIVLKIILSYCACRQMAFNQNNSFYINKKILDGIQKLNQESNTGDCVSDIFKKDSEDNATSFAD